jgi:hypothetical protein
MALLNVNGICSKQFPSSKGDKFYLSIYDLDAGVELKVGVPVKLDEAMMKVPVAWSFVGFAARPGKIGLYLTAETVSGKLVK